jgi:hypothetical protein
MPHRIFVLGIKDMCDGEFDEELVRVTVADLG